jgi:hypothetical protein
MEGATLSMASSLNAVLLPRRRALFVKRAARVGRVCMVKSSTSEEFSAGTDAMPQN